MKSMWPAFLCLLVAAPIRALAQDTTSEKSLPLEARLSRVEGTVYIHVHGQPDDEFIEAQQDAQLGDGDLIRTGEDGRAEIALEGPSVIDVSPNTDFTVTSLTPEDTIFGLSLGSFVAKIRKLAQSQRMRFATPTAVAAVRGTELSAESAGEGEPAHIGVYDEGHVAVTSPGLAGETQLGPGQESEIRSGAAPGAPRPLSRLLAGRARLAAVRQRQEFWRQNWRATPAAQRRAMRQGLLRRPAVRASELRRMGPAQRRPWKAMAPLRSRTLRALARPVPQRRRQAIQDRRAAWQRQAVQRREAVEHRPQPPERPQQRMPQRRFQKRRLDPNQK